MDFFLWEYLKQLIYPVPFRAIEDRAARLQTAVTVVDANMLRHVQENSLQSTAILLEMDYGHFEHLL
jgi:hypothetical protein